MQTPDLEIDFSIGSGAESNIINIPTWNEIKILHPKLITFKTTSRLATAQGSTLTNYGKINFFLVPTRTMEQNKLMSKPFKQTFHITDIKHNTIGIPFITKYIPTIMILNKRIHINDKYTRTKNTALTFFQRINKQPQLFSKMYPIYNQERKHLKPLSTRPFYNNLRKQNNFEWTTEHQKRFKEIKTLITQQLSNTIPEPNQPFYAMCDASKFGIGAALLQSYNGTNKMNFISANFRLFTQAELRLSTLMRECTAILYTLIEYECLILGYKQPTVLLTNHKPIIFLFSQKSNPNCRVYRFQLNFLKFLNLHKVWTAGKNLALPDTLSRNTPPELLTRKTTVEILQKIKFSLAKDETSPRLQCKYAVKIDIEQSQISNLQH